MPHSRGLSVQLSIIIISLAMTKKAQRTGDKWYKLAKQYYKNYKVADVEKFICSLNDMKNNTLVLDTTVYLPNIQ